MLVAATVATMTLLYRLEVMRRVIGGENDYRYIQSLRIQIKPLANIVCQTFTKSKKKSSHTFKINSQFNGTSIKHNFFKANIT